MAEHVSLFQLISSDYIAQLQGRNNFVDKLAVLFFHRGFHTMLSHRLQCALIKVPLVGKFLAKILWYFSCAITGCDLSYYSLLGSGVYLPHPTGIVIGDYVRVGKYSTILQQVTLGTKTKSAKGYPVIGDNVYLGAGCKVLGGINIGDHVNIGANAVVLQDIPDNSTAVGIPARYN